MGVVVGRRGKQWACGELAGACPRKQPLVCYHLKEDEEEQGRREDCGDKDAVGIKVVLCCQGLPVVAAVGVDVLGAVHGGTNGDKQSNLKVVVSPCRYHCESNHNVKGKNSH